MQSVTFLLVLAASLIMIQCSPLHHGIMPKGSDYPLSPDSFSVAVMGDIPYSERQVSLFKELIKDINADNSVDLVLHAGDIKGGEDCNDQLYRERFQLLEQFKRPVIYSIGDNEWTDCHHWENGKHHPLNRLQMVRHVFFPNPGVSSGGHPIPMQSQSRFPGFESYVEHQMVQYRGIVFGTVHVVGSNNGLAPWVGIDQEDSFENPRPDRLKEFTSREHAVIHWLTQIFKFAQQTGSQGILLLIQANPLFEKNPNDEERAGFNEFVKTVRSLAVEYGKPVLLTHGHIHYLWIDKPLFSTTSGENIERLETFTRIQTPGSPFVRWIKITIDPQSPDVFLLMDPYIHKLDSLPW